MIMGLNKKGPIITYNFVNKLGDKKADLAFIELASDHFLT